MKISEIRKAMIDDGNDIYFMYNGRESGVSSTVVDSAFIFHTWHGTNTKSFDNFDAMVRDKFFGGRALKDFVNEIDVYFC